VIEVVTPKQRNRSFSVFGSLADDSKLNPDEESNDSAEVLMKLVLFMVIESSR
jgi:protein import protein ZIM17